MTSHADPANVLIIEDDPALNAVLVATLKAAGYRPVSAKSAAEGLRWFAHSGPDIILLDLGLPDRDGLEVIREVRLKTTTPIIVLSARDAEATKVAALDLGADDYTQKPFGIDELMARLRAGLRHGVQLRSSAPLVTTGDLEIDLGLRRVTRGGLAIDLSPKAYDLLVELSLNLGHAVTHAELLRAVWGSDRADIQYLRVYVAQLRQKLGSDILPSTPGVGYRLRDTSRA